MLTNFLSLTRPLALLDFESTGKDPQTARVVEIALRAYVPGEISRTYQTYINPGIPIPEEATKVHGITDDLVKDAPTFAEWAATPKLGDFDPFQFLTSEIDFAGFNVRYDVALLVAELMRLGVTVSMDGAKFVDGFRLWQVLEPRTLSDAVKHFLGREHSLAHSAQADIDETEEILDAQLGQCLPLVQDAQPPYTVAQIHDLIFPRDPNAIDDGARFVWNQAGIPCVNFGKYKGRALADVVKHDKRYLQWFLGTNITPQVRTILTNALEGVYPQKVQSV